MIRPESYSMTSVPPPCVANKRKALLITVIFKFAFEKHSSFHQGVLKFKKYHIDNRTIIDSSFLVKSSLKISFGLFLVEILKNERFKAYISLFLAKVENRYVFFTWISSHNYTMVPKS